MEPDVGSADATFGRRFVEALRSGGHALSLLDYATIQSLKRADRDGVDRILRGRLMPGAWRDALASGDLRPLGRDPRNLEHEIERVREALGDSPGGTPGELFARALRLANRGDFLRFSYTELQELRESTPGELEDRILELLPPGEDIPSELGELDLAAVAVIISRARGARDWTTDEDSVLIERWGPYRGRD